MRILLRISRKLRRAAADTILEPLWVENALLTVQTLDYIKELCEQAGTLRQLLTAGAQPLGA